MTMPTPEELILDERKFLHEMASQLLMVYGSSSFIQRALKDKKPIEEKELEHFEKILVSVNNMTTSLKERRTYLHGLSKTE